MKDSNSSTSGGLANISNRGWWRLGTDMTGGGRGRGTLERTHDIWQWQLRGYSTSGSLAKGDLQLTDDNRVIIKSIGKGTIMNGHYYFFLYISKGLWAVSSHSLLLWTQSWFRVVSGCYRLLIRESRDLPWRKTSAPYFCSMSILFLIMASQTWKPQPLGWRCCRLFNSRLFGLTPSVTKEHFSWLVEGSESTQVLGGLY